MMSEGMQWFVQDVFNTPLGWLHTCSGPRGIVLAHGIGSGLISLRGASDRSAGLIGIPKKF